jgi:hypothetical protein
MIVISSTELRSNMKKYLDIANRERVLIQRGRTDSYLLLKYDSLDPDIDLARAITHEDLLTGIKDDIRVLYSTE